MIAVVEPTRSGTERTDFAYTPERIDSLLRRWPEVLALAETPQSARGLARPMVETRDAPKLPMKKRYHGDALGWASVVADVERAWAALTYHSLEWRCVELRMQGHTLGQMARAYSIRTADLLTAYRGACKKMAATLGYVESDNESLPGKQNMLESP